MKTTAQLRMDEYKRAVKTVQRVRDRMRQLGRPMPGQTS